jgi:hypothetical protein
MVNNPTVQADDYLVEDAVDATPKHGTTVQAGWDAASAFLKTKEKNSAYPTDFKFSDQAQLVRFLDDGPFLVYEQHWIDREGRKSFVCIEDCPLCNIAGDKPRPRFAFNIISLSEENPEVQIMTVPKTMVQLLQTANDDPRRGPLTKFYWSVSRLGTGRDTQYTLDRVKATDLAEEWELDADSIDAFVTTAVKYDAKSLYISPREELLEVARALVA